MDKRSKDPSGEEVFEGPAHFSGDNKPTSFPHVCPYQLRGADRWFCNQTTINYQRNIAGCCGTQDSRGFGPCNSELRKCRACLADGAGAKASVVEDVHLGLCSTHAAEASKFTHKAPLLPLILTKRPISTLRPPIEASSLRNKIPSGLTRRPVFKEERVRGPNIPRAEKIAALAEASNQLQGRPKSAQDLVKRAVEILRGREKITKKETLYSFVTGGLTDKERASLGLKAKQRYVH